MARPTRREVEETDRLITLSDGVIAIVITLLVLDLTVPPGEPETILADLLLERWHEYVGFALSFLVVGLYWVLHRRTFVHIAVHDRGVVWLNLVFLLFVAFVPFATSVFTDYPNQVGITFYAGVLALTGFSLAFVWIYAARRSLVADGVTSRAVQLQTARYLASPAVFLASIVLATFDPTLAVASWLLLFPINAALQSRLGDPGAKGG